MLLVNGCLLRSYEITFSEVGLTPANRNRLGRHRIRLRWHAPMQTFGALRQTGAKWRWKTHFSTLFFCHQNNASFRTLPSGRFPWNINTKRQSVSSWILSKQNCEFFPIKDHLSQNLNF